MMVRQVEGRHRRPSGTECARKEGRIGGEKRRNNKTNRGRVDEVWSFCANGWQAGCV